MKITVNFNLDDGQDNLDWETFQKMHELRRAFKAGLAFAEKLSKEGYPDIARDLRLELTHPLEIED